MYAVVMRTRKCFIYNILIYIAAVVEHGHFVKCTRNSIFIYI